MNVRTNANQDEPCPLCYKPAITRPLRTDKDVLACLKHFRDKRQEFLVCLSLDSGGRLINQRVVTIGLLDTALAHPREIFVGPLSDLAASVIIAHNHPSGVALPSDNDVALTQQLVAAGQLLGIPLQDHFIITKRSHFSFQKRGLIANFRAKQEL